MQDRNAALERDVSRYKERKKIEHDVSRRLSRHVRVHSLTISFSQIALLEILVPVQTYREIRVVYLQAKTTRDTLRHQVEQLKARNAPAHALKESVANGHESEATFAHIIVQETGKAAQRVHENPRRQEEGCSSQVQNHECEASGERKAGGAYPFRYQITMC
jgi:hypothetical protein